MYELNHEGANTSDFNYTNSEEYVYFVLRQKKGYICFMS